MKQDIENIDYEWLTRPTGDPFTDAGGYALEEFSTYFPDANIMELIEKAATIYVRNWDKKVHSFFLNSPITQPSFKGKEIPKIKRYFEEVINNIDAPKGYCRITGKYDFLFIGGRHNSILTGSSAFTNFHHGFQEGIMVSKEVIIRNFFAPLACEQLLDGNALICGNSFELSSFFAKMFCKYNMENLRNNFTGIYKSKFKSANTALFHFADEALLNMQLQFDDKDKCSLQLYMFTNFATSPNLQIILLPFPIWQFYRFVKKGKHKDSWQAFVSHHFYKGNKKTKDVGEENNKYWNNQVYDHLIENKSILQLILKYIEENNFDFTIVKYYAIKIRKMKKETIGKIEQLADFIIEAKDDDVKRAITELNAADSSYSLRRFVLSIAKRSYDDRKEDAIVTVKDYVEYLFPDIDSWKITRDVLLIAIYERLHHQKRFVNNKEND